MIAVMAFILVVSVIYTFINLKKNNKKDEDFVSRKKKSSSYSDNEFNIKVARFFAKFAPTKKLYARVRATVSTLNPTSSREVESETGKILMKAIVGGVTVFIANIALNFLAGFSIFYLCAGVFAATIIIKASLTNAIREIRMELLLEEQTALSSIRHNYHTTNAVDRAINMTITECKPTIAAHLSEIYRIVTSANMEAESANYIAKRPDRYLLMFLSICTATKEFGDTILENGQSLFNTNIAFLKEEVENEVLALKKQTDAFRGVQTMMLGPLFAIKPLEAWAKTSIPEIGAYYTGIYSSAAIVFTFLATYIIYSVVEGMQDGTDDIVSQNDSIWAKIAQIPFISKWLNRHISGPKYNYYKNLDSKMRGIGDHTGTKAFIVKRVGFGIIGVVAMLAVFFVGTYSGKTKILKDFSNDFNESVQATDEYKEIMRESAELFVSQNINKSTDEINLVSELKSLYGFNDTTAKEIETAIKTHISEYKNKYFKWWQLLLSIAAGFALSFLPLLIIKLNESLIDARRQEEVMQFQTLMLILMHIPSMDVSSILEWMGRFSSVFTESIVAARAKLGSGMKKALLEMKDSEVYGPFKEFTDNLLAIDDIGIADAFDEVRSDHEYYMETKKAEKDASIKKKSEKAHFLCEIPFYMVLGIYLIIPMIRYAISMFEVFSGNIN